jgi:AcrR family transcriptional regulator
MPTAESDRQLPLTFPNAEHLRPPRLGPTTAALSPRLRDLLDQIEEIFVDEGFHHLTVTDLAARLHCSRRTLYELAQSRDELALIVLDRRLRRIGRHARQQLHDVNDPADLLSAFLTVPFQELHRHSARFSADIAKQPASQRLLATHIRYYMAILREILDQGVRDGHLRPFHTGVVAEVIDAAMSRLWQPDFLAATGLTYEDAVEELSALIRAALVNSDGTS